MSQSEEVILLKEIRDLLHLLAEPQLAKRDSLSREKIRQIAGNGTKKRDAIMSIDGVNSRKEICTRTGIDSGNLSRLLSELSGEGLLSSAEANPKLVVTLPSNFFTDGPDEK